jgi:hypothetical protein
MILVGADLSRTPLIYQPALHPIMNINNQNRQLVGAAFMRPAIYRIYFADLPTVGAAFMRPAIHRIYQRRFALTPHPSA